MGVSIRVTALAAMIAAGLGGASWVSPLQAADAVQAQGRTRYLIDFAEPGVMDYRGDVVALRATAPETPTAFNVHSEQVQAYSAHLKQVQAAHIADIKALIGRAPDVSHYYLYTTNGIALELTADEAARVATMPGVKAIYPDHEEHLDTYRGPSFIGADTIWNGSQSAAGYATRGKGVVVGIIDSGMNSVHPAFANDPACGFSASNPKLLSARSCATTDTSGVCNGPNPESDAVSSGHGVHTAGIAAGNVLTNAATPSPNLPSEYTSMSGVAPCASLRTYKVCNESTGNCSTAHSRSAVNNAISDGDVRVINFSISGGTSPWSASDNDRDFLNALNANILVAASAGNTSATVTTVAGQVNHRGPWVMTVAASQTDRIFGAGLSAVSPGSPPSNTQNLIANPGSKTPTTVPFSNLPVRLAPTDNALGCDAFPADYFAGGVALIQRGTCSFYIKVDNAAAAGAQAVFIYNNAVGYLNMDTSSQVSSINSYSITQAAGNALAAFVSANGATPTIVSLDPNRAGAVQPDVIADFSLRGPTGGTAGQIADVTKPDITGPGVLIYAPWAPIDGGTDYLVESGTSMSSPHLAGAAALVRSVQPTWTPAEVKSAIQMTASVTGYREDGVTPWTADDIGSGRVDLSKATRAGFVLNETYANFLAANGNGASIKNLNLAQLRSVNNFTGTQTWTRTLRNALPTNTTWTATINAPAGVTLTVTPSTFSFTGAGVNSADTVFKGTFEATPSPETQALTITAASSTTMTAIAFGEIIFTEANNKAPPARFTVAVRGRP